MTPTKPSIRILAACSALMALAQWAGAAQTNVWNVSSPDLNPWSTGGNWTPAGPPGTADTALFGVTGTTSSAATVNNVVGANTTVANLAYTNGASGTWHVTQIPVNTSLTVSGAVTVGGGVANSLVTSAAMTGAGTFIANGSITIGNNGSSSADQGTVLDLSALSNFVYAAAGGTITLSTGNRSGADFKLAGASNNITAGTWNHNVASSSSGASGTLTLGAGTNLINVGTFNIGAARESATVTFPATGGLRLRGVGGTDADRATMVVGNRSSGNSSATSSSATLSFNGHPIDVKASTLTLGENTQNANASLTETGTLSFNQGTFDATTINMAVIPSANTQAGSVANATINVGGGTLVAGSLSLVNLSGAGAGNSATGTLNITNGGTVSCSGSITKANSAGSANISVTSGFLAVQGTLGSSSAPINNLNLTNATLTLPAAVSAPANVTALSSGGTTNQINVSYVPAILVYPTQFPLLKYASAAGDLTLIGLGTLPGAYQGYVSNNTGNLSIDLVVTGGPAVAKPITWDGALSGDWDTTTANWKTGAIYNQNDFATFDDTATGATAINLTTTVTPGSLTVNNSALSYTFSGAGGLSGGTSLAKQGTGTLMLDNSGLNDFSGGVTISAGTLQLGNNDANGNLPATGSVTDNGSLIFSRSDNITVGNVISGSGTVTNSGGGTLTLSAANSFAGGLTVSAGTVRPTNVRSPGTGTLSVNSGGSLVLIAGITNAITLAGGTLGVSSAADFTGTNVPVTAAASTASVVQTADPQNPNTTRNVQIDGVLLGGGNILVIPATNVPSADSGQGFRLRGTNFTSTFSGTITLSNNVKGELLTVNTNGTFSPAGTGKLRLVCGAFDGTNSTTGPIVGGYSEVNLRNNSVSNVVLGNDVEILGAGTTIINPLGSAPVGSTVTMGNLKVGGGQEVGLYLSTVPNHVLVFPTVTLTGGNAKFSPKTPGFGSLTSVGSDLSLGDISELTPGSGIIMGGWRTLFLTGNNTYSGNTMVNNGTLALVGSASIASSPAISVASGATFDVSALTGGFTLLAGQTLSGGGGVNGNVTVADSATAVIHPGGGGTIATTLTFKSNLTFTGVGRANVTLDLSGTYNGANDQVVLNGAGSVLTGNSTVITLHSAGTLDTTHDYVLFNLTGATIAANSFSSTPAWSGTTPKYASSYSIVVSGSQVLLRFTPIALSVRAATDTKTYDGTTNSSGTPTLVSGSLAGGDTAVWTQAFADRNAGTGKTLIPAGAVSDGNGGNNYAVTFLNDTTGVISAKPITVTAVAETRPYDGTTSSAGIPSITPALISPDTSGFTQAFETAAVGTGKTLIPGGVAIDGNGGNNYAVTFVNNTSGSITSVSVAGEPRITATLLLNPTTLRLIGTNVVGSATHAYNVWASADLSSARDTWQPAGSGVFAADGGFTNDVAITESTRFFLIQVPLP